MGLKDSKSCISVIPKQDKPARRHSQKKEEKIKAELYGALQLLLGGAAESYTQLMCSQQHTAKARALLHPSTALSSARLVLSVLSVNYMALATETRSYPPPIFILFFTDSRLREGENNSERRKGCHCTQSGTFNVDKKATKIYSLTSHDDYSNVFLRPSFS